MKIRRRQKGQALFLGMVLMAVCATAVFVMYNTSQMATEKSRLVNAADGAAYSGAVWAARNMNFMAYTNRAMIANHVAVGHYVSYVSWTRYVEEAIDRIEDIGKILNAIPGGQAIHRGLVIVQRGARGAKELTERFAPVFIRAADSLNRGLSIAQLAAHTSMATHAALTPQAEIMKVTASAYDPSIRINDLGDIGVLRGLGVAVDIAQETSDLQGFIRGYSAGRNDGGRMLEYSRQSYGSSRGFIDERGWGSTFVLVGFTKKNASTTQRLGRDADWVAEDSFEYKWPGGKWTKLASEQASARGLTGGRYTGISSYYDVQDVTPNEGQLERFTFTAYATMPMERARLSSLMGLETSTERMAAISRAEIFYQRPEQGFNPFNGDRGEFANVFNPFWEARLVEPPREMLQGIL